MPVSSFIKSPYTYEGNLFQDPTNILNFIKEGPGILKFNMTTNMIYSNHFKRGSEVTLNGFWSNNKLNGLVEGKYSDGSRFLAEFKDDNFHGEGEIWMVNGKTYKGNFLNGVMHGYGEYGLWRDELHMLYKGEFLMGEKHGYGKLEGHEMRINSNSEKEIFSVLYEGEFSHDVRHGKGEMQVKKVNIIGQRFSSSDKVEDEKESDYEIYDGYWEHDVIKGVIRVNYRNGDYYEGELANPSLLKDGIGMLITPDGVKYKGEFKFDLKNGIYLCIYTH